MFLRQKITHTHTCIYIIIYVYIYIRKIRDINVITFAFSPSPGGIAFQLRKSRHFRRHSPSCSALPPGRHGTMGPAPRSFNSLEGEGGDTEAAESPFWPTMGLKMVEMAPIKMAMTWGRLVPLVRRRSRPKPQCPATESPALNGWLWSLCKVGYGCYPLVN